VIAGLSPVLVANRGEIAIRVIRTCRRLGLQTVAVYSDADAHALHVAAADTAVHIGASLAAESYLNQSRIRQAAQASAARAIHPGYGFLSENPEFAQAVIDAGLVWIGPTPAAMRALGDKARAKSLAEQQHVPLLPGFHGDDQSLATLRAHAERIGYPVLIKASAGGGGRGMRVVEAATDFEAALDAARREARASFGDDRVLLERFIARPRHIEVQIVGDAYGNQVHLGERECSIQRRHQKLIEESPSPAVDDDLRHRMGEAALRLSAAAGYTNAGTVEFLVEPNGGFAFLEVNARLQVEHPVTEAVTGLDMVELQLRVAAGERLGLRQQDIVINGHAIEARVIAEDPLAGWVPSSGTVEVFRPPESVRVDTWLRDDTRVSPYYDSLLAKVIAHDVNRDGAARRLAEALREMRIEGVRHNLDLLLSTVQSPAFLRGELSTRFVEEHQLVADLAEVPPAVMAAASAFDRFVPKVASDPWQARSGWRQARLGQPAVWIRAGREHLARVSAIPGDESEVTVDFAGHNLRVRPAADRRLSVDGQIVEVWDDADLRVVEWQGRAYRLERRRAVPLEDVGARHRSGGDGGEVTSPMPGRVVKIAVQTGDHVTQNQPLLVLEAMKMEHVVEAPHAAVVTDVHVQPGEQVTGGALLITLGEVLE